MWLEFYKNKIEEKSLQKLESMMKNNLVPLCKLKVQDLIFDSNKFLEPGNGVYIFYDKHGAPLYVGKASSRSFIERIPAHFDLRESAWFNSFLKKYKSKYRSNDKDYFKSVKEIFKACSISWVHIPVPGKNNKTINKVESLLRASAHPKLNPTKRKIDSQKKIKSFIKE